MRLVAACQAAIAVARCFGWMIRSRPDLVVGVGGFASGPAVLAAKMVGIRTMVMEQNHFPGATNRWLAPRVDKVCLPSRAAQDRLGTPGEVTGNPVRREFEEIGRAPGEEPLSMLVFGGSRGARSINTAMIEALPHLASLPAAPAIVHQTGTEMLEIVKAAYRQEYPAGLFEVRAFLDDMPARLAQADLVVSRAGATTLAELAAAGRPAILVPFPHASDDHQRHNAEAVADAGAAVVVTDRDLTGTKLVSVVGELTGDRMRLQEMGKAARKLATPGAARRIVEIMEHLVDFESSEDADVS